VPHVGTWIEIIVILLNCIRTLVVPHVGTWIEMLMSYPIHALG